jgi:hypothetical protein
MPQLIKKINTEVLTGELSNVVLINTIRGEVQGEDYVEINGFIAFTQNLTKTDYTEALKIPRLFGLINRYNVPVVTLNIDY